MIRPHIELSSLVSTSTVFDWLNWMSPEKSYRTDHKRQSRPYGERLQELNLSVNLLSLSSMRLFMDAVFLFKCIIGLYDVDVSTYLVTADCSGYNRRHTNYQFKIRYARTNALKFSYFFWGSKSWNSLLLRLRKTESLTDFEDRQTSFLHLKHIRAFS